MFTERSVKQVRLEIVVMEELVPQDHLLRKIDASIDSALSTGSASRITARITDALLSNRRFFSACCS